MSSGQTAAGSGPHGVTTPIAAREFKANTKATEAPASACRFASAGLTFNDDAEAREASAPHPVRLLVRTPDAADHWWWYGGRIFHDLAGIALHKPTIVLDYEHGEEVGYLSSPDIDADGLWLDGAIVPTGEAGDPAPKIIARGQGGVPYEASIYFDGPMVVEYVDQGATAEVNGAEVEGPCSIVRECVLRATAICAHGADRATATEFAHRGDDPNRPVALRLANADAGQGRTGEAGAAGQASAGQAGRNRRPETLSQNPPPAGDPPAMSQTNSTGDAATDPTDAAPQDAREQSTADAAGDAGSPSADAGQAGGSAAGGQASASPGESQSPAGNTEARTELARFMEAFGDGPGAKFFAEGKSFTDALAEQHRELREQNAELRQKLGGLEAADAEGLGATEDGKAQAAGDGKRKGLEARFSRG
ncbi:MAG: hypothetical protein AAF805_00265 [Planctomycetota bacterium]